MKVQTEISGRIVGSCIAIFVILLIWARMKPAAGIPKFLLESNRVDSIRIERNDSIINLKNPAEVSAIAGEIKRLKPVDPQNPRLHLGITYLDFFTGSVKSSVRILYTNYDGVIVAAGERFFNGESLDSLVSSQMMKAYPRQ